MRIDRCRRNIRTLCDMLCIEEETAYAMMLVTAALMDLTPDDKRVMEMILTDCKVEVEA